MIAETLRRMADQYYSLAVLAEGRGESALAASHRRAWQLMRDEALKLEAKYSDEIPGLGRNVLDSPEPPHDDPSDGLHDGECELEDGYGEWPYDQVKCVKCLAAVKGSK